MSVKIPTPKYTFTERAAAANLDDASLLNSNNAGGSEPPSDSDVVVAGAGIHSLIYSVHAAKYNPGKLKISVIEKNSKPGYKIGESTLPYWSIWCKMHGWTSQYNLRLFGLKEGLNFYFLDRENQGKYTDFASNGLPATQSVDSQLERSISELFLTLLAQRSGVNVYHGKQVDFPGSKVTGGVGNNEIKVGKGRTGPTTSLKSSLLVDATGRFRQLASKHARVERFEGWNYDAFWSYFTCPKDESNIPFKHYEGAMTNHLCTPEGWAWVIRLLSWEGNPIGKLMDMINYLLDCAEAKVPGDELPSIEELSRMFDLKHQWVTSIGFACRNDVKYPEDMSSYGSTEGERKFNYIVSKYSIIQEFMKNFEVIPNLYENKTWFIRKSLTFKSPVVSGPGWVAIGDACGFTNPLFSPGITVCMATSTYAAELTHKALEAARSANDTATAAKLIAGTFKPYDDWVAPLYPQLNQMNRFQYVCFRDPRLGPRVSCFWQFVCSVSNPPYGLREVDFCLNFTNFVRYNTNWAWGSYQPVYDKIARKAIELLAPIPLEETVPDATVKEVLAYSEELANSEIAWARGAFRWDGLLRYYDADLNFHEEKTFKDVYSSQCPGCAVWMAHRPDWKKCFGCGRDRTDEEAAIGWAPTAQFLAAKAAKENKPATGHDMTEMAPAMPTLAAPMQAGAVH